MKPIDFILIALIAVVIFFAIRRILKTKKNGGCGCSGNCESCASQNTKICDDEGKNSINY